jgi:hypothetical protein
MRLFDDLRGSPLVDFDAFDVFNVCSKVQRKSRKAWTRLSREKRTSLSRGLLDINLRSLGIEVV